MTEKKGSVKGQPIGFLSKVQDYRVEFSVLCFIVCAFRGEGRGRERERHRALDKKRWSLCIYIFLYKQAKLLPVQKLPEINLVMGSGLNAQECK